MAEQAQSQEGGMSRQTIFTKFRQNPRKALEILLLKAWANHQSQLRILMTGKTGQGKSSLVNGLVGEIVAEEGPDANACTSEVKEYLTTIEGIPVAIFDSPGLQDGAGNEAVYLQKMQEKCQKLSLAVYCMKMIDPRLTNEDKNAMKKLTKEFGMDFWKYSVIALTFANMENCGRRDNRDKDVSPGPPFDDVNSWNELKKRRFQGRLKIWEDQLRDFLLKEAEIDHEIVEKIPVVPTGDYEITVDCQAPFCLPDREDWFNTFWECCCLRIKDTPLFLRVNMSRMVVVDDVDDAAAVAKKNETDKDLNVCGTLSDASTSCNMVLCQAQGGQITTEMNRCITCNLHIQNTHGHISARHIYITNNFATDLVTESVERSYGVVFLDLCKKALKLLAAPARWLFNLFKK